MVWRSSIGKLKDGLNGLQHRSLRPLVGVDAQRRRFEDIPPVSRCFEALDVGILHGLAGIDEVQLHPMGASPSVQDPLGEFRAVVYGDQLR